MKRLISFIFGVLIMLGLLGALSLKFSFDANHSSDKTQKKVLNIYNWGDYISPDLLQEFTKETGYSVNYMTFDSNEAMYTKIKQGGTNYDIAVPSDYMIDKMKSENLLVKFDKSKIKGLENLDTNALGKSFDPENMYSVPYFWGTLGIVYNDTLIDNPPEHWEDLWSSEYRNSLLLTDGAREVLGMGLTTQGQSVNSTDEATLEAAYHHLEGLTPNIKAILADEIKQDMVQGEAGLAVTYSGIAAQMEEENSHLHYVLPKEGGNLWFDNLVIPKTSKNKEAAYAFINFMLKPENAAKNAEYVGYATPNLAAKKLLPAETTANTDFYPSAGTLKKLEVYQNLGPKWLEKYNDLFLQLKMYRR